MARFASFSAPWRVVRTGGSIEIPQVKVPVFKPGKALKNAERRAPDLVAVRPPAVH